MALGMHAERRRDLGKSLCHYTSAQVDAGQCRQQQVKVTLSCVKDLVFRFVQAFLYYSDLNPFKVSLLC